MSISDKNTEFWNELCGSQLAKSLGITDSSAESLKKFDDWYFDFYPYLFNHIPFEKLKGKAVLEVGLGYGTVSQRLSESGALYTGLDIAAGPVNMVNHRLKQTTLGGKATQGSILEPPFPKESFDVIVAIGCLHHTGDLKLAIKQCAKLLRTGGKLIFMVYYSYSYRRWRMAPVLTLQYLIKEIFGSRGVVGQSSKRDRAAYDLSSNGDGAPHTDWISSRSLNELCKDFSSYSATIENIDQGAPFSKFSREKLLKTRVAAIVGLDLYATVIK
jgi:2-polyprenyl-3-methyl-5-hydroxy-6-metoxy-1,4-benzoquinol methylase